MKPYKLLLAAGVLLLSMFVFTLSNAQSGLLAGTGYAPNITVTDLNGTSHTIYDYLDSKKFSEEINSPEILAEKIIKNFETIPEIKSRSYDKLNSYSKEIFENVTNEYQKLLK